MWLNNPLEKPTTIVFSFLKTIYSSVKYLSVIILSSVKKLTIAFPWALISAYWDSFIPPNGK